MRNLVLISFLVFFAGCTQTNTQSRIPCDEPIFDYSPIALDKIKHVVPLGNLNPEGGHTLPTRHMYFYPTEPTELVAPARIRLTNLHYFIGNDDYEIGFEVCEDVRGYFIHLDTLSPVLAEKVGLDDCEGDMCFMDLDFWVEAGEVLGTVGGKTNFDFGLIDSRITHDFVNPLRYGSHILSAVCCLDYYNNSMKELLYSRLDGDSCGTVMHDVEGTLQGNWFEESANQGYQRETYSKELAFVPDNVNTSMGIVSVGGTITEPSRWGFTPTHEGTVNREPSEIVPGDAYCYEHWSGDRVLIQLLDETTLKIEHQIGLCEEPYVFENPFTYLR